MPTRCARVVCRAPDARRPSADGSSQRRTQKRARSGRNQSPANRRDAQPHRRAIAAGARRIVGGSFALIGASTAGVPEEVRPAAEAIESMETQILEANRSGAIEGVVLRYGLFYGPEAASTVEMIAMAKRRLLPAIRGDRSLLPCIHVDDAASATLAALDRAPAGGRYDIVDDAPVSFSEIVRALAEAAGAPRPIAVPAWLPRLVAPYMARMISLRLPLSNAKARADMEWRPAFPTMREGLRRRCGARPEP
jgi:nucleoside-diphosphate-sugar epimerase